MSQKGLWTGAQLRRKGRGRKRKWDRAYTSQITAKMRTGMEEKEKKMKQVPKMIVGINEGANIKED